MEYPCLDGKYRDFVPGTKSGVSATEPPVGALVQEGNAVLLRTSLGFVSRNFFCLTCSTGTHPHYLRAGSEVRWEGGV